MRLAMAALRASWPRTRACAVQRAHASAAEETTTSLKAVVQRLTYYSKETGWAVAKVKPLEDEAALKEIRLRSNAKRGVSKNKAMETTVSVVGTIPGISEGMTMTFTGWWSTHAIYGAEFKVTVAAEEDPGSKESIEHYLSGGILPGVGKVKAKALVDVYGEKTLEVLDSPDAANLLCRCKGIGKATALKIKKAWDEGRDARKNTAFLRKQGLSSHLAQAVVNRFGSSTEAEVRKDPFKALHGLRGGNFLMANKIALSLGLDLHHKSRYSSAILHEISSACAVNGHTYLPWDMLKQLASSLLLEHGPECTIRSNLLEEALLDLSFQGKVVIEADPADVLPGGQQIDVLLELSSRDWVGNIPSHARCYLHSMHTAETDLVRRLQARLLAGKEDVDLQRVQNWIERAEGTYGLKVSDAQKRAIVSAAGEPILLLTGGPGCGKTYATKMIVQLWKAMGKRVALCAPTGRAAQRLAEISGFPASTVHRLLQYNDLNKGGLEKEDNYDAMLTSRFQWNGSCQLELDCVVVDEASMLDLQLSHALVAALPENCKLLVVGDCDQLPSIGPGFVFKELLRSSKFPSVELDIIFRQCQGSNIVTSAHAVNSGIFPNWEPFSVEEVKAGRQTESDAIWFCTNGYGESREKDVIEYLTSEWLPERGFDVAREVQFLTPVHRGSLGTQELNKQLQELLNPSSIGQEEIHRRGYGYRVGDKVIQLSNDYDKDVFNGDLGIVRAVDKKSGVVTVSFGSGNGSKQVDLRGYDLDSIAPAWAITVHKSQGSEFPVVVLALSGHHRTLLSRGLVYTAVTRASKLLVVVSPEHSIHTSVQRVSGGQRYCSMKTRIVSQWPLDSPSTSTQTHVQLST